MLFVGLSWHRGGSQNCIDVLCAVKPSNFCHPVFYGTLEPPRPTRVQQGAVNPVFFGSEGRTRQR